MMFIHQCKCSMTWFATVVVLTPVLVVLPGNPFARAQNDVAEKPTEIDFRQLADLKVKLSDEQGNPIAGAEVMPYAMRVKEENGHGYWPRNKIGDPKTAISDDSGQAIIQYPIHIDAGPTVLTTTLVTFSVKHSDYVKQDVHFNLGPEKAEVTLKAGCEVQITAIDANGDPVTKFAVLVAGKSGSEHWADSADGGRRTRAISDGTWQTMLVKVRDDGPTLFSSVLPLRVRPSQSVRLRGIAMLPGARIRGTISADVPRPVAGYVIATSAPVPANESWSDENPSVTWHDWVNIEPDGTFELESMPRGGELQIIAICDGWISTTTVPDARVVTGQIFPVEDDEVAITVEMERTGTVELTFTTEDGKPFTEGEVFSSPNERLWKGGTTLLGQRFRSDRYARNQLLPPDQQLEVFDRNFFKQAPFYGVVDQRGTATLKGLPVGFRFRVSLGHPKFRLSDANRRGMQFKLDSPEPLKFTATVVPAQ